MLRVENLSKSFDRKQLWEDVSFTIPQGTMAALTGPSGCGKTTLLDCLGTLEKPNSGRIFFGNQELTRMSSRAKRTFRATTMGYVVQDYGLMDNETVAANIAIALPQRKKTKKKQLLADALEKVQLSGYESYRAHSLSGGEQQRVSIARLYVREPALILADEPTGSLDAGNAGQVLAALRERAQSGATVVISTHDKNMVKACDMVIALG